MTKRYIQLEGSGKIKVKAKNLEEARAKVKLLLEEEFRKCDKWEAAKGLRKRWEGLAGIELKESSSKKGEEGIQWDLFHWKNNSKGSWKNNKPLFGV